ncbi:MAG: exopolysaccharide Pel transporter PelG [Roseibacillus sp.]|jgi:uncharacterized membrane protein
MTSSSVTRKNFGLIGILGGFLWFHLAAAVLLGGGAAALFVGSFFLVMFHSLLTVLFYFDDRKGAVGATFCFFAINCGVTLVTLLSGQAYYGVGYVLAAAIAFAITAFRTNQLLENLDYRIFTANPFPKSKTSIA